jgi:hypothetical protein
MSKDNGSEFDEPSPLGSSTPTDRDLMIRYHMALQAIMDHSAVGVADAQAMRSISKRALVYLT